MFGLHSNLTLFSETKGQIVGARTPSAPGSSEDDPTIYLRDFSFAVFQVINFEKQTSPRALL